MRIAKYELLPIETGRFALDGGAMFGVVPKTLWAQKHPPDERNRVPLALRALLIRELDENHAPSGRNILVDTGAGQKWDAKNQDIFAVDHRELTIERSLAQHGLRTEDISDVLLTHLHFDHAGGATKRNKAGKIVPTFQNARYHVQKQNLEWAQEPSLKDRASYLAENFQPLLDASVLTTIDGPGEFLPGIELIISNGHTFGMQLPLITGEKESLFYCADLIPTASHIKVPWVMAYDNQPLVTIAEKQEILARAVRDNIWLFFEHDIEGPAAKVEDTAKGYRAGQRSDLLS